MFIEEMMEAFDRMKKLNVRRDIALYRAMLTALEHKNDENSRKLQEELLQDMKNSGISSDYKTLTDLMSICELR